jgi:hypothetical protein
MVNFKYAGNSNKSVDQRSSIDLSTGLALMRLLMTAQNELLNLLHLLFNYNLINISMTGNKKLYIIFVN